jgi:hypothetical protein
MHSALMKQQRRQQTALLLHDLAHCHEVNRLMARTAAWVLRAGPPDDSHHQQQEQERDNGHPLRQICSVMTAFDGWNCFACPTTTSSNSSSISLGNASNTTLMLGVEAADVPLLMSCLTWHQHQQMLLLMGWMPRAASGTSQLQHQHLAQKVPVEEVFGQQGNSSRQHQAAPGLPGTDKASVMPDVVAAEAGAAVDLDGQQQQQQVDNACATKQQFQAAASGTVYGLTAAQLLLLAQGDNAGLLSLLLLDSVRLLLMQQLQDRQQHRHRQQQPWQALLFLLQNMASHPNSSSLYREAAVSCLAALYRLAVSDEQDAQLHMICGSSSDVSIADDTAPVTASNQAVVGSLWNVVLLRQVLSKMIQQSVMLTGLSNVAEESSSSRSRQAGRWWWWWLLDGEAQQTCQAFCSEALLLLNLIAVLLAATTARRANDRICSAQGKIGGTQAQQVMQEMQQLWTSQLEQQQQLLPFLCWAAARGGSSICLSEHASQERYTVQQHQRFCCPQPLPGVGLPGQLSTGQQMQHQQPPLPLQPPHFAGATGTGITRCSPANTPTAVAPGPSHAEALHSYLSNVCLQLLAALLAAGCLQGQLSWLEHHLQQQLWVVKEQQQHEDAAAASRAATAAGAGVSVGCCAGGQSLTSPMELVRGGTVVALLRPGMVQQLLMVRGGSSDRGDSTAGESAWWGRPSGSRSRLDLPACGLLLPELVSSCEELLEAIAARPAAAV